MNQKEKEVVNGVKMDIQFPWLFKYTSKRPAIIGLFAILFFLWKLIAGLDSELELSVIMLDPFVWFLPLVLLLTALKMSKRVVLTITEQDIHIFALFGPSSKRYRYQEFSQLIIQNGKLYLLREDPDTREPRPFFLIAGWAIQEDSWLKLAQAIKSAHDSLNQNHLNQEMN